MHKKYHITHLRQENNFQALCLNETLYSCFDYTECTSQVRFNWSSILTMLSLITPVNSSIDNDSKQNLLQNHRFI